MDVLKTKLERVLLFKPETFTDYRGLNMEIYNLEKYSNQIFEKLGEKISFVQDNITESSKNVLRGIHGDSRTWKLATCLEGEIFFVVVNCEKKSKHFGKWQNFYLTDSNKHQVLVPPNFGNAHLVLSQKAIFHYKWSEYFEQIKQFSYRWDDPKFGIIWPIKNPILSKRDKESKFIE